MRRTRLILAQRRQLGLGGRRRRCRRRRGALVLIARLARLARLGLGFRALGGADIGYLGCGTGWQKRETVRNNRSEKQYENKRNGVDTSIAESGGRLRIARYQWRGGAWQLAARSVWQT